MEQKIWFNGRVMEVTRETIERDVCLRQLNLSQKISNIDNRPLVGFYQSQISHKNLIGHFELIKLFALICRQNK